MCSACQFITDNSILKSSLYFLILRDGAISHIKSASKSHLSLHNSEKNRITHEKFHNLNKTDYKLLPKLKNI